MRKPLLSTRLAQRSLRHGVLLASALIAGCSAAGQDASDERAQGSAPIPAVEVVQARHGALPLFQRLTGTVRAAGEVAIYPQAIGSIVEVLAQNGDAVKKGAPLVRIQVVGSQAQLAQARSTLEAARAEHREAVADLERLAAQYERNAALGKEGLVPDDTVVTLRRQVEAARAAEARTRAQARVAEGSVAERTDIQQQTIVRAPISGRVGQRNAEVGMRVDEQTALFIIGRLENVRVEVPVTQEILARVKEGDRVEIGLPVSPIAAKVSRISPFLEPGSYSAEIEIDVPNRDGRLVPGMFVTTDVFYGESEEATLVPTSALYEHPTTGERGVFVTSKAPAPASPDQRSRQPARASTRERQPDPVAMSFKRVDVIAVGPDTIGVRGIDRGAWVVVVGQHLLAAQAGDAPPQSRVRAIEWNRILELQRLQRDDLLREFMDKQQRLANRSGARSGS